jgi:hypothetical protein
VPRPVGPGTSRAESRVANPRYAKNQ